jgi:isoquinoline 1-oxidoreductase subunit alpha
MITRFHVNGIAVSLETAATTPLLWILRDHLQLPGTKFGCGAGLCGACTLHLQGQPVRACVTPISEVAGKQITTIEAIGMEKVGSAVQAAWLRHDVAQCGYCQSGQIMAATALLKAISKPTNADINTAMAGNICRCGTYVRIRAAIKDAASELSKGELR